MTGSRRDEGRPAAAPIDRTTQPATPADRKDRDLHGRTDLAGSPADPSSDPAWERHVEGYFNGEVSTDEAVPKASHEMKEGRKP